MGAMNDKLVEMLHLDLEPAGFRNCLTTHSWREIEKRL